uniref:Uncharacterized protein n=1 Tax=Octopus bimaculoides TaxID=37653 RepID=A0A0L8GS10_OCTBM
MNCIAHVGWLLDNNQLRMDTAFTKQMLHTSIFKGSINVMNYSLILLCIHHYLSG